MRKSRRFKIFFFYYFPVLLWMGVIFVFSSISGYAQRPELTAGEWATRKGAHVGEFFVLTVLLFRSVWKYLNERPFETFVMTGMLAYTYAVLDEIHQYFVPLRQSKMSDVLIDMAGIFLGLSLIWILWKVSCKREECAHSSNCCRKS